jgi:hypothetical protein
MLRVALGALAAILLGACVMLPLPGYGGVIYLPSGKVELPREMSLDACAAAVRAAATSGDPASSGRFHAMALPPPSLGNVLGVCSGPDGARHLVRPDDIQPGLQIFGAP